jgi:hypothetical protein
MAINYNCKNNEHQFARRSFLGGMLTGATAVVGGLGAFTAPQAYAKLNRDQKRIVVFNMHGGLSQLESWDPKPGTDTGGPTRAIATSVPGIHIADTLPHTAKQMHNLCLVRSVNTKNGDHGKGRYMMLTGRAQTPAADYPEIGAVAAKTLNPPQTSLPGHIRITPGGSGGRGNDSAYLGPKYASISLDGGKPPQNTTLPKTVTAAGDEQRNQFRQFANTGFLERRRTAMTDAFTYSYEQAEQLMRQRDIFDITKESEKDTARYGSHDFGRHCLLARRLLENNISFVQVSHSNYDTHNENFNFHLEQLEEFDSPFATFVGDLADRGMLESTLIVVLSEFGRTPRINDRYGRDHWGNAWSVALGGCGVTNGASFGATNENGTKVVDGEIDHRHLFHTYLSAVGVDPTGSFDIGGRDMLRADPEGHAIKEILV